MNYTTTGACALGLLLSLGCGDDVRTTADGSVGGDASVDAGTDAGATGLPLLGGGTHTIDAVALDVVATADDALDAPRDLAFNPEAMDQLWVANESGSMAILLDPGTPEQDWRRRNGPGSDHFFATPSALAFGEAGTLASVSEEDEETQPSTPTDFMGPTLWTSIIEDFDAGHGGHLDMLHNSPNSVGIAWERGNAYWIFDGAHGSLTRYDFQTDHGLGGADHSDGIVFRYAEGQVARVPGVSSHMFVHEDWLYVADSGNGRIVRLDIVSGTEGARIGPNYDGTVQQMMDGAVLEVVVAAGAVDGLQQPSGLEVQDGMLFVTDAATSRIFALTLAGEVVDWLDVSPMVAAGSLMGIAFHSSGDLFLIDHDGARVLRLRAL